jgi:hypothetical protein
MKVLLSKIKSVEGGLPIAEFGQKDNHEGLDGSFEECEGVCLLPWIYIEWLDIH